MLNRVVLLIILSLSLHAAAQTMCSKAASKGTWKWGIGGGVAWAQLLEDGSTTAIITFRRSLSKEAIAISVHDATFATAGRSEFPAFASVSIEAPDVSPPLAVDGTGLLQEFQGGKIGLTFGNTDFADSSHTIQASVVEKMSRRFLLYIDDACIAIPLTPASKTALQILHLPQASFVKRAASLNDVRDGKRSEADFTRQ